MEITYLHPLLLIPAFAMGWVVCYIQLKYGKQ